MRKIFFLSALVISAMSMAQSSMVNWYDLVTPLNSIAQGSTAYEDVQVGSDGSVFLCGNIGSVGMDPHAVVMGDTISTVAFKEYMAQTNSAPFFVKLNSGGDVDWTVVCNDGRFTSYTTLALSDGGMLVAATAYQSQASVMSFVSHYTPSKVSKYDQSKEQYGVLLKIASDGTPSILNKFEQAADGQTAGIAFYDIVTDGTDYYILASISGAIKVLGQNVTFSQASVGSGLAIMKFNAAGEYQGLVQTDGVAVTSKTAKLVYANSKLYLISTFKGTTSNNLVLGAKSVAVPNALNNIAIFEANTDLTCSEIYIIAGEQVGTKNNITTYDVESMNDALYISGFFTGTITTADNSLSNSGTNAAFIAKFDLSTKTATKGLMLKDGTGISSFHVDGLMQNGDSLYAYYYDWGATGDRVFLQALDADLQKGSKIGLISTTTQCGTRGAAIQGDNLIYCYYAPKGLSKLSADNSITFNPTAFRGLVVSQKIFDDGGATPVNEVREDAKSVNKRLNQGNVYVLRNGAVFTAAGQRVE